MEKVDDTGVSLEKADDTGVYSEKAADTGLCVSVLWRCLVLWMDLWSWRRPVFRTDLRLWRYLVYLSRNDRQKIPSVEKCKVLKRSVKTQETVSSKVLTTLARPAVLATFGLGDESEDDWDLSHMGREDVQLPAIQAPVIIWVDGHWLSL